MWVRIPPHKWQNAEGPPVSPIYMTPWVLELGVKRNKLLNIKKNFLKIFWIFYGIIPCRQYWGHGGRVVTLSPPTSEAEVRFPARPQVGKLVVACCWSAVYSTETWRTVCTGFLRPSNYPSWYDLYSVESNVKPQINKCKQYYWKWSIFSVRYGIRRQF